MASLREIMNVDEDGPGSDRLKRSAERRPVPSASDSTTPATSSSYTSPTALPASLQVQPRPPPPPPPPSSSAGHHLARHTLAPSPYSPQPPPRLRGSTSPASVASSLDSKRRRSSAHAPDLMEPPYYGSQPMAHPSPGATATSSSYIPSVPALSPRQYTPLSGTDPAHGPKLTPVTGRVSRAKKGVPVHVCDICHPPKTFTRAEHLRRHQLSHQPPELACAVPGCDKVFHRKDLLDRHQARHEQEARGQGDAGSPRSTGSTARNSVSSTHYGAAGASSGSQGYASGSAGLGEHGAKLGRDADASVGPVSWTGDAHNLPGARRSDRSYRASSSAVYGGRSPGLLEGGYAPDRHWTGVRAGSTSSSSVASSSSPPAAGFAGASSGVRESGEYIAAAAASFNQRRQQSSATSVDISAIYPCTTSARQHGAMSSSSASMGIPVAGYNEGSPDTLLGATSSVSTLPPLLSLINSSTSSDTMVAVSSQHPIHNTRPTHDIMDLSAASLAVTSGPSPEAKRAIPCYISIYWERIHSMFPVIHRVTFEEDMSSSSGDVDMLECAMAALATQFLEDKSHRVNGNELHAYASNACEEYTRSDDWPLRVMQTVLLTEHYARFRGRHKESHRPSARFHKLYQMVIDNQMTFSPFLDFHQLKATWRRWLDVETRRRLLATCFMLDVHGMMYYEQPPMAIRHLDYSTPSMLAIPLTMNTTRLWDAPDARAWDDLIKVTRPVETVQTALASHPTADDIAAAPAFDAANLLCACALQLPRRTDLTKVAAEGGTQLSGPAARMAELFPGSGTASTYLALHHTPLHVLLSVSGDSWVFNKKVSREDMFSSHQKELDDWCRSEQALVAVTFAARGLKAFLGLADMNMDTDDDDDDEVCPASCVIPWREISDYWGAYACSLICWAFGKVAGEEDKDRGGSSASRVDLSRATARRWILRIAGMEPAQVGREKAELAGGTKAVVCLVRDVLARDRVGGRSILLADAVGVLRKLC